MSASTALHSWQNLSDDILRQVFSWTHPLAGASRAPVGSDTLHRLGQSMQSSLWVCRHWRQASEPMQHSTALVHVSVHLVATSTSAATTTATSNVGLILANPRGIRWTRALVVCVGGPVPSPAALLAALRASGMLGAVWSSVHTLRFTVERPTGFAQEHVTAHQLAAAAHTEDVARLNTQIAQALPALRHIDYTDFYSAAAYRAFPLTQLLRERTAAGGMLQSVRVFADTAPRWPDECVLSVPVVHMHVVDTPRAPRRPPRMAADSLVELTLTSLAAGRLWESFVPSRAASGSEGGSGVLEFACLRSLTLLFFWRYSQGHRRRLRPRPRGAPLEAVSSEAESGSDSASDEDSEGAEDEDGGELAPAGYTRSSAYGRPMFPRLERLGIHRFPGALHRLLSVFNASPVRALVLAGLLSEIHAADIAACTQFERLGSLDLRLIGHRASEAEVGEFELTVDRVARLGQLRSLALSIEPFAHVPLPLAALPNPPDFAHSLRLLRLSPVHDVNAALPPLLHLLPSLLELHVSVVVQSTIPGTSSGPHFRSLAALLQDLRSSGNGSGSSGSTGALLKPASLSVRRVVVEIETPQNLLEAFGVRECAAARDVAVRGVLRGLLCRMPAVQVLRVSEECVGEMRKSVRALVSAGIVALNAPALDHLETMVIRPLE
ncbi:hypothetical protein LPJ53_003062 [Coemansia erecta]|uniref:Uncharacterized protein n=1 Tax=Coemansia erecta TaxID=147472 RepID=A0A9W7XX01_9FUNG|nr:hypothetical protein LPJ53_003062 [Coemansia erecta]